MGRAWMMSDEEARIIVATELKARMKLAYRSVSAFQDECPQASSTMFDEAFRMAFGALIADFDVEALRAETMGIQRRIGVRRESLVLPQEVPVTPNPDALGGS